MALDPTAAVLTYTNEKIGIQHTKTYLKFDITISPAGVVVVARETYGGGSGGKGDGAWTQPAFEPGEKFQIDLHDKGSPTESKKLLLKTQRVGDGAALTLKFKGKKKIALIRKICDQQYEAQMEHTKEMRRIKEQHAAFEKIEQEKLDALMAKKLAAEEEARQKKAILAAMQSDKEQREDEEKASELVYRKKRRSTVISVAKEDTSIWNPVTGKWIQTAHMEYSNDLEYDSNDLEYDSINGFDNANMVPLPYNNINNEWSPYNGYYLGNDYGGNAFSSGDSNASMYGLMAVVLVVVFLFVMTVLCCVFGAIFGYASSIVIGKVNKNVENNGRKRYAQINVDEELINVDEEV